MHITCDTSLVTSILIKNNNTKHELQSSNENYFTDSVPILLSVVAKANSFILIPISGRLCIRSWCMAEAKALLGSGLF
jgi:hypothetical protein